MLRFKFSVLNGEKVQGSREKGSRFKVRSLMRTRIRWRGKGNNHEGWEFGIVR
jgi:hypothetical protein